MNESTLPLHGITVVDLTRNVAGPYATMILADLGADVLKVEQPSAGDDTRQWGPPFWGTDSPIFLTLNRNKRSMALDLKDPEAARLLRDAISSADVLVESFRPGRLEDMGFGYDWASQLNPRLVYCSITGFGDTGPLRSMPGYDPVIQAFVGLMSVTGEEGRPPVRVGTSIIDMGTGMWAAMAVQAALLKRVSTGHGARVSVSLYETGLAWMAYHIAGVWATGTPPGRSGSAMASISPYEAFASRDGYVIVAAGNDGLFHRLARQLGHAEWTADARFLSNALRVANRPALHAAIEAVTAELSSAQLVEQLSAAGIPVAPVRDTAGVCADAQAEALGMFVPVVGGHIPDLKLVALPMTFDGQRPPIRSAPPTLPQPNPAKPKVRS